jgi:hypothetical protein
LGTKSFLIIAEHGQPMDEKQLDVVVQLASYMPFDTINGQRWLAQGANILSSTRQVDIVEHVLEAL